MRGIKNVSIKMKYRFTSLPESLTITEDMGILVTDALLGLHSPPSYFKRLLPRHYRDKQAFLHLGVVNHLTDFNLYEQRQQKFKNNYISNGKLK